MTRLAFLPTAAAAVLVAAAVAPVPAAAQSRYALTPFVANNPTLPGPSALVGASLASYPGVLGARVSGAAGGLTSSRDSRGNVSHRVGAYTADVDGVFNAAAIPGVGVLLGGFVPALFAGVGVEGGRVADSAALTSGPVMSYGATVSRTILGGVGVETEARYRVPTSLDGGTPAAGLTKGWEYRLGLTIGFGGRGRRSAARSGRPAIPLPRWPVASSPSTHGGAAERPASASAARVLAAADRQVGTRYVYGGTTPEGFDCSGFVRYVYRTQGVELPRTSRQQSGVGARVTPEVRALRPGDLMLFDASGDRAGIDHVAIYAGRNRMIHASSSGGGVRYDDLSTKRGAWFTKRMVAARRVVADGRSLVGLLDAALRAQTLLDPPDQAPRPAKQ